VFRKVIIAIPQARQRRATIRSHETAQKIQYNNFI
jgi:hypothetical protein